MKTEGYITGEVCNRNECTGIIREHLSDGSCSCHINPPCSYCTESREYCPVCGWEGLDEQQDATNLSQKDNAFYKSEQDKYEALRNSFYKKFRGEEPITELEMRIESHTHFSQKVVGVFPEETETKESLLPKVKGTFGGRFTMFLKNKFEYIAYTD